MLTIFIAEDEINILNSIKKIIEQWCFDVSISGTAQTVEKAINILSVNKPDLLLLDINFPDGTGFDILEKIKYNDLKVIFITAFEEYALKAIKVSASDFLLKPIKPKDLIHSVNKIKNNFLIENQQLQIDALLDNIKNNNKEKKIVLKTSERLKVVKIKEIVRAESDGSYAVFYLTDKSKIIVSKPLKEYDDILFDFGFLRVHKSYLVNIEYIDSYEKSGGGYLKLIDGNKIPVSVRKKEFVINKLNEI